MSYVTEIVCIQRADIGPLKICPESILELFPTSNGVFGKAFEPMTSWPFELEEMISMPSSTYPSSSKGQLVTGLKASPKAPLEVGKSSKTPFGQIFKGLMSDLRMRMI